MYGKIMSICLTLPVIIFSMDQKGNPDSNNTWLMNNDGAVELINNDGVVKISNQHPLCSSKYLEASRRFKGIDDLKVVSLPPVFDIIPARELTDAIDVYGYIINNDLDSIPNKLQDELQVGGLQIASTAMKLAYHLFDTKDNFCKTVQYFFQQMRKNWSTHFYPRRDSFDKQAVIRALKEKYFPRTVSVKKSDKVITANLLCDSMSCSLDGIRFAINDDSWICNIYNHAGKIVDTIDLETFYDEANLRIKSKNFFFKDDGSVDVSIHCLDKTGYAAFISQIFEYKNGDINKQNIITLPTESSVAPVHLGGRTYAYVKGLSSIEAVNQKKGELIFNDYGEFFTPTKLHSCGSDVIVVDSMDRLTVLNTLAGDCYPLDIKSEILGAISDTYLVIPDNELHAIRFFERDSKDQRFYEISQYTIARPSTARMPLGERIRSVSISPDGTTCAALVCSCKRCNTPFNLSYVVWTLEIIDIMDIYNPKILRTKVLPLGGRNQGCFVEFLNNETLIVSLNYEIRLYTVISQYLEVDIEASGIMKLLEKHYLS